MPRSRVATLPKRGPSGPGRASSSQSSSTSASLSSCVAAGAMCAPYQFAMSFAAAGTGGLGARGPDRSLESSAPTSSASRTLRMASASSGLHARGGCVSSAARRRASSASRSEMRSSRVSCPSASPLSARARARRSSSERCRATRCCPGLPPSINPGRSWQLFGLHFFPVAFLPALYCIVRKAPPPGQSGGKLEALASGQATLLHLLPEPRTKRHLHCSRAAPPRIPLWCAAA